MTETVGHRLIREVNNKMTYRFGRYVIPSELALEIKSHFDEKNKAKDNSRERKINYEIAQHIRFLYSRSRITIAELARRYDVDYKTIWRIIHNITYTSEKREY